MCGIDTGMQYRIYSKYSYHEYAQLYQNPVVSSISDATELENEQLIEYSISRVFFIL